MSRKSLCCSGLGSMLAIAAVLLGAGWFAAGDEKAVAPQVAVTAHGEAPAEPGAAEAAPAPDGQSTRLRFDFRHQPWGKVFDWLSHETGLSVQMDAPPRGTFNYSDSREYTPAEAIDLVNRVLSIKGSRLVRRGRALILVDLDGEVPSRTGRRTGTDLDRPRQTWPAVRRNRIREVTPSAATVALPPGNQGPSGSAPEELARLLLGSDPGVAPRITRWGSVEECPGRIAVFKTVFWDPRDTISLRQRIKEPSLVKGKTVLEIGTGSGVLALCCVQAGASRVTATDVNRWAIDNAAYNADRLGFSDRLDLRLVPLDDPGAYSVIGASEKFDLIISNPPWEDGLPTSIDKYAYYDKGFRLLRSLLSGLRDHLKPGGRVLLAYGSVDAIKTARRLADQYGLEVTLLDDRVLDELPDVFLPGMLLEITPR